MTQKSTENWSILGERIKNRFILSHMALKDFLKLFLPLRLQFHFLFELSAKNFNYRTSELGILLQCFQKHGFKLVNIHNDKV